MPSAPQGPEVTVVGVNPNRPRTFYAYHAGRNLGGEFTVTGMDKERVEFRLQPAATLTGRLVGGDGKPIVGYHIGTHRLFRTDPAGPNYSQWHYTPENIIT